MRSRAVAIVALAGLATANLVALLPTAPAQALILAVFIPSLGYGLAHGANDRQFMQSMIALIFTQLLVSQLAPAA